MFQIFRGQDGLYYWHAKAANGEILCHSEGYQTEQNARNGIDALIRIILQRYFKK